MPTADESIETAERVERIKRLAVAQFGSVQRAQRWLSKPNRVLDGRTPLELLATEDGALQVESTIMRIAHGIFF